MNADSKDKSVQFLPRSFCGLIGKGRSQGKQGHEHGHNFCVEFSHIILLHWLILG